jgi:hypothetical protein
VSGLFIRKPVVIEASLWLKLGDHDKVVPFRTEMQGQIGSPLRSGSCRYCNLDMGEHGWIDTLEGGHIVCPGDWIIKGVKGEFYACKPDIFAETYDEVLDDESEPAAS